MSANAIETGRELQQVLWACYQYWAAEITPPHERTVCYSWVIRPYEKKFGTRFHQSRLQCLAEIGFLKQEDTSRSGNRRYYTVACPYQVNELLKKWGMA